MWVVIVVVSCSLLGLFVSARSNAEDPVSHHILLDNVGLGTAGLGRQKTHEMVLAALNLGVRMIDSAQAAEWYDEVGVGSAVSQFLGSNPTVNENEIVIVTKVHPRSFSYEDMEEMLIQSKNNFRRDYLDVVLLHSPWCWREHCTPEQEAVGWETGWKNLVALRDKHNVKNIGVSNFHMELLHKLVVEMGAEVDIVQNWMDPFHQDHEVRDFCVHQGIQYMAYSSFGTQWNRNPNPVLSNPILNEIADMHSVSVTRVVMAWLDTEGVIAIPRSSRMDHMEDNFAELMRHRQARRLCAEVDAQGGDVPMTCADGYSHASWHLNYDELQAIRFLDGSLGNPWD